jgi:hypothetical protein
MDRGREPSGSFPSTRHSVLSLARSNDTEARRRAHDAVASAYWKPVTVHPPRWHAEPHDAEDLTQGLWTR